MHEKPGHGAGQEESQQQIDQDTFIQSQDDFPYGGSVDLSQGDLLYPAFAQEEGQAHHSKHRNYDGNDRGQGDRPAHPGIAFIEFIKTCIQEMVIEGESRGQFFPDF